MAFYVETVQFGGWSRRALDYLLYIAENPHAPHREICEAVGITSIYGGTYAAQYRKKLPGWREVERELRSSPEACAIFMARMHLPATTKAMLDQAKSGKAAVAAATFVREMTKPREEIKPVGMPDWLEGMLNSPVPALPPAGVIEGEVVG